jgi:hypothetical protein
VIGDVAMPCFAGHRNDALSTCTNPYQSRAAAIGSD